MTEIETFKKIRQTPVDTMLEIYLSASTGLTTGHQSNKFRPDEVVSHHVRLNLLEKTGGHLTNS